MNKVILLNKRPAGRPTLDDFKFTSAAIPVPPAGNVLIKTLYVSVDPYLRGRMSDSRSYVSSFVLGEPIQSGIIGQVIDSKHPEFRKGDFVSGILEWTEYQVSDGKGLIKVDDRVSPLPSYLGARGMTGLTAYLGLTAIGVPKAGETIVVSGAAGAVGSMVGQIGKIMLCNVVM